MRTIVQPVLALWTRIAVKVKRKFQVLTLHRFTNRFPRSCPSDVVSHLLVSMHNCSSRVLLTDSMLSKSKRNHDAAVCSDTSASQVGDSNILSAMLAR